MYDVNMPFEKLVLDRLRFGVQARIMDSGCAKSIKATTYIDYQVDQLVTQLDMFIFGHVHLRKIREQG